jgi:flagellar biosynthesis/type III secretory pathway protein FliH
VAHYRYQEEYLEHLREQQRRLREERFDYDRDPYFYTAPIYRYRRGGRYYETNRYGANVLRQALHAGYEQGFRCGEADRRDRWRAAYRECYAYRDANYGYRGYYISRSEYNYYFREGFRRGYEDGYHNRHRYGRYANGHHLMSDNILSQILNFESIR